MVEPLKIGRDFKMMIEVDGEYQEIGRADIEGAEKITEITLVGIDPEVRTRVMLVPASQAMSLSGELEVSWGPPRFGDIGKRLTVTKRPPPPPPANNRRERRSAQAKARKGRR